MKIGLIGYGAWGSHHASAIVESNDFEIAAVCSQSEPSRQAASKKLGVPTFADYRDLIARPDLDAVDIVLPTHLHREVAAAALEAGKHVLLEKPMTATRTDCLALIDLSRSNGKILYIGHELRHSTQWGRMRMLVEEGAVGTPLYATIDLWRRPYRLGAGGWRYDPKRVGNWILEEPIHFFDLARWYFSGAGEPSSVFARANARNPERPELQDNFSAIVNFPGGAYAV